MDVWEYFQTREREIGECSLHIPEHGLAFAAEPDGQRGLIYGPVLFNGYPSTVYLIVYERVVVTGSGITRPRYAYYLVIDGREIGGYERHATHHPPVHKHCSAKRLHESSPSRAVSFKDAANEAWRYVADFAVPDAASRRSETAESHSSETVTSQPCKTGAAECRGCNR